MKALICSCAVFLLFASMTPDVPSMYKKKVNKTISGLWNGKPIEKEELVLTSAQSAKAGFTLSKEQFYTLKSGSSVVGYLYLDKANGKFDKFDYMVIFRPDLTIMTTKVLIYREEYGGEIGSERWLRQFNNKKNGTSMEFGKDIQNIAGATISVKSITLGVKKLSKNISALREAGII